DRVYDIEDVIKQILSHFDDENRFILPDDIIARSKKKVEDAIASRLKSDLPDTTREFTNAVFARALRK
ncbi:MAG: hypothetical protein J5822_09640, partial [Eubacteriaceae bacterium]|nr:hypothetical protein [Eubacteriaceae bacterium]